MIKNNLIHNNGRLYKLTFFKVDFLLYILCILVTSLYDWKENIAKFSDIQTKQQSVFLVLKYTTLQPSKYLIFHSKHVTVRSDCFRA